MPTRYMLYAAALDVPRRLFTPRRLFVSALRAVAAPLMVFFFFHAIWRCRCLMPALFMFGLRLFCRLMMPVDAADMMAPLRRRSC